MIHFAIGTKAQFIKMAPLMYVLQQGNRPYHLLDLSQHATLTSQILEDFRLRPPVTHIETRSKSVTTYGDALLWLVRGFAKTLRRAPVVRDKYFLGKCGVVMIHGDTLSTLLGLRLARSAGLPVAMVEAGLSSGSYFDPFPEEWIRHYAAKHARYLFPPDERAEQRLLSRRLPGTVVRTPYNTGRDALQLIQFLHRPATTGETAGSFGVATLHRLETLAHRKKLERAIRLIRQISEKLGPIRFYTHPPTVNALVRTGLMTELQDSPGIQMRNLAPYPEFAASLVASRFILTDGGSIQEEASYLNKPCVLLRNRTERNEGLERNTFLTSWNADSDASRVLALCSEPEPGCGAPGFAATRAILDALSEVGTDAPGPTLQSSPG
jgi:UDP-N-acetylglucosamine 2-epimerase (non-hydrolysing)